MADIRFDVTLGDLPARLARQGGLGLVRQARRASIDAAGPFLQRQLVRSTPRGATGELAIHTMYERSTFAGEPQGFVGPVGAPSLYAEWVELGRRPGKMPPLAPIAYWVQRVIRPPATELESVIYLVRRKIARQGTAATHYIRNVADANRQRAELLMRRAAVEAIRAARGIA